MPKIDELLAASPLTGQERIPLEQGSGDAARTRRATLDDAVARALPRAASMAALRAVSVTGLTANSTILLQGYYTPEDGGGGLFRWSPTETGDDNLGLCILPTGHTGAGRWMRHMGEGQGVNVLQFGARGDGATNDAAAVQAALNAARFVTFPAGRSYAFASTVTIPSGRTLWAYGARLLPVGLANNASMLQNLVTSGSPARDTNINILGADLDGNGVGKGGVARTRTLPLVRILRATDVRLIDCNVHDIGYIGVQFNACQGVMVRGCVFARCGWDGTDSADAGPALVIWSTFAGENSEDATVTGNRFLDNEWSHLYLSAYGASITGNVFDGCYEAAIWAYNRDDVSTGPLCRRITIVGNVFQNIRLKAVSAQAIELTAIEFTISGNMIFDTDLGGITLYHAERGVVANNVIVNTGKTNSVPRGAIELINGATRGNCEDISITGNTVFDTSDDPTIDHGFISFTRGGESNLPATGITLRGNHFRGPFVGAPITFTSNTLTIAGSLIRDNLGAADVSGITVPGPFANDAAAAAAGVQVGQSYRLTATDAVMVRAA